MTRILAIGDSHVSPEKSNERFGWLGQYIVDTKPDIIAQLGDFLSLESLSHWDKNKRLLMEGRRYRNDIEAGQDALTRLYQPIREYYSMCRRMKRKTYWPELVWIMGNHEEWVPKYLETHPELDMDIDLIDDLQLYTYDRNVTVVPYGRWELIDNVAFTHAPIMANGRPVQGSMAMASALSLFHHSVVFGHLHHLEFSCTNRHGRQCLQQALSAGCFFEGTFSYCETANNKFWRGVVMIETRGDGSFDFETISLDKLREMYG